MAKTPKIPGGLPEVTEWSPEPPQPKFTPNQPEFHGNGRYGAPANPEMPTLRPATPAAPTAPAGAQGGWFRRTVDAVKSPGETLRAAVPTAEGAGRALGNTVRVAGRLAPAVAAADAVSHANDFKINDPSVDSSASGTFNALRQGDFAGAGRSLSKGALETLMDVGSAGANVADFFVPGKAPVSTKYGNMLREKFGDQLVDGSGAAPSASTTPVTAPTATPASTEPNVASFSNEGRGKGPTGRPATAASLADPNGAIYRDGNSFSGKDVKFGAGVYNPDGSVRPSGGLIRNQDITNPDGSVTKSTLRGEGTVTSMDTTEGHRQNLLELQRNAAERANAPPMGGATGIGSRGNSMLDDLVAKHNASKGPDMAGLSPYDKAQMQASLRQSQDANANARTIAGLNNETARAGMANTAAIASMQDATQRRSNDQNNATSLRGQDLSLAGHMAPLQLAAMQRDMHAKAYGAVGAGGKDGTAPVSVDQHLAAAKLLHAQGMPEQAAKAEAAAAAMTTLKGNQDNQASARVKDTTEIFKPMFTTKDKDGNDKFDEVGAAKAAATVRGLYGDKFDMLSPEQKRAAFTDVVAKQRNSDAERQVMPGFVDRMKDVVGMYEKPPEITGQRDLRGGVIERAGLISPPGVSRNSKLVRLPNGQTINYGEINDAQFRDLEERTQLRNNPR